MNVNNGSEKPDREQFAKAVLWQLAGIRAEIHQVKRQVAHVLSRFEAGAEADLSEYYADQTDEVQRMIYRRCLEELDLEDQGEDFGA